MVPRVDDNLNQVALFEALTDLRRTLSLSLDSFTKKRMLSTRPIQTRTCGLAYAFARIPDLSRFIFAQEDVYETALSEVQRGRKDTHWMWFIFP